MVLNILMSDVIVIMTFYQICEQVAEAYNSQIYLQIAIKKFKTVNMPLEFVAFLSLTSSKFKLQ